MKFSGFFTNINYFLLANLDRYQIKKLNQKFIETIPMPFYVLE
jgi:hypothetical protein